MSTKLTVFILAIPLLVAVYFFENIKGYYRFKWYCENEGGLKVYEKLEKNKGWMADDKLSARSAAQLKYVDFVRFPDKKNKNKFYDMRYNGGHPGRNDSYKISEYEENKTETYYWKFSSGRLPDELRLTKQTYKVMGANRENVLIVFNRFGYSKFDRNKTLLAAPSGVGCYDLSEGKKLINENFTSNSVRHDSQSISIDLQ